MNANDKAEEVHVIDPNKVLERAPVTEPSAQGNTDAQFTSTPENTTTGTATDGNLEQLPTTEAAADVVGAVPPATLGTQDTQIEPGIELDATQILAINQCCNINLRICAVTGPAGTGKTTIKKNVYDRLVAAGYRVVACAPTGKAARRIREATGIEAFTIHKLLEYPHPGERNPKTGEALRQGYPTRDRHNPLEYDVVLADEYAMVNHEVHSNLVDALPRAGMLRAFGDVNQLPPIERVASMQDESPFQMLLKRFPSIKLTQIHRQGEGSGIVKAGVDILSGRGPRRADDFIIEMTDDPVRVLERVIKRAHTQGEDFRMLPYQVISPTKKSWVGTVKLNATLQQLLNPAMKDAIVLPRHSWAPDQDTRVAVGDKIVWTQNNYDLEIMNGETGTVTEISDLHEVIVDWGDRIKAVPPQMAITRKDGTMGYIDPRKDIDLAYCLTTHKSQGSEFKHVIYILNKSSLFMQNQANYYTAVTRARHKVTLVTDQKSFWGSLQKPKNREKKGIDQ